MTIGAPDWQQAQQHHTQVLFNDDPATYPVGVTTKYAGPSSAWASLQVRCQANSGFGHVFIHWYTDAAFVNGVGVDTWAITPNTGVSMTYPVQAPFVRIGFSNTSAGNDSIVFYVVATQIPAQKVEYLVTAQTVYVLGGSAPANGNVLAFPAFVQRGPAQLLFQDTNASGKLGVSVRVLTDDSSEIAYIYAANPPQTLLVTSLYVPDQPLALNVFNTDAVNAHPYDLCFAIPGGFA